MHFHAGAVQAERLDLDADDPVPLQLLEHAVQHAVLRPAVHPRVNRVPIAEPFRQPAPFAAVFGHEKDRVEHLQIRKHHVPPLPREQRGDLFILSLGQFHQLDPPSKMMGDEHNIFEAFSVNTP